MAKKKVTSKKLRLRDYEHHVRIRPMTVEDFSALVDIQQACFPGMKTWERSQIESQLRMFPEGQIVVEFDGQVVASSSSLIVDFSEYEDWHDWKVVSDSGYIRNHDPEGDTLYGIEIMVHPKYRGMKLARRLYDARKEIARQQNLMRIIIAGRIPGYGAHAHEMSAREYVETVMRKEATDPVLTPQVSNGFVLRGLIPSYLPSDVESRGYATHLEWTNLDHVPEHKRAFKAVSRVRVCAVQYHMRAIESFDDFARQVEFFVDVASDYHSDFIAFPELFTLQLLSIVKAPRPGEAARLLSEFTPQYFELFNRLAMKYHVNIVGGSQFTLEENALYNVAYLFRRDGTMDRQYKIHITPNERKWWGVAPGSRVKVMDTDCGKIAIQICYDIEFPEITRLVAAKGARIVFVPFNTDEQTGYLRVRHCAQARCIENHLYTVIAGCTGNLPFVENADIHYAQSAVFTPSDFSFSRGGISGEMTPNIEQVLIRDLDVELVRRHRLTGTTQNWNDRRTDLYRVRIQDGDDVVEI